MLDLIDPSMGILLGAVLFQSLLPVLFWCCATMCMSICTENDDDEENQPKRRKKGFCDKVRVLRAFSMAFYTSFFLWLIYFIVCKVTSLCAQHESTLEFLNYMAMGMLVICPLFVLVESFFSLELTYLNNIMQGDTAWGYIQKMHTVAPVISMTVECYHMEIRTRRVNHTDAHGNTTTRNETYQERVVTYVDNDIFKYGCWVDVSKKEIPAALRNVALTRLKIESVILFGDQETGADFNRQKEDMFCRNRHRDMNMDFSCRQFIPGVAERISAYVDMSVKPWWIGTGCFWFATVLMLTWPYRWLFKAKTAKNHYDLKKKMYKSTSPTPDNGIINPVSTLEVDPSNVNPSFVMTNLSTSARQTDPPHYTRTAYPPNIESQTYPTANHGPSYPPFNQGAQYPPTNLTPHYFPANQAVTFQPANQGAPYPSTNQGAPYPPTSQGPLYSLANQQMPSILPQHYVSTPL